MNVTQTQFRRAVLNPDTAMPEGLTDAAGTPDPKRFDVYRNNVAVGLTEALKLAFPVVLKLVGDEFFTAMAGVFLRRYPPRSPMIMLYGADFPGFIRGFQPVSHLQYLPGVARLEQARRVAYHAADAAPFDPAQLQALSTEELMAARLVLAPAVQILRSDWPVHAIWDFNSRPDAPEPKMQAQDVLVSRPEFDPVLQVVPESSTVFVQTLLDGGTFAKAMGTAKAKHPEFNLQASLGTLITGGAIAAIEKG